MNQARRQPLTEDEFLEQISGYLLDALEPDEALRVEEYLNAHPEMQPRVLELEQVVAEMAYVPPSASPSSEIKRQILERARLDAQSSAVAAEPSRTNHVRPSEATQIFPPPRRQSTIAPQQQLFAQEERRIDHIRNWFAYAIGWKIFALGATAALAFLAITFVRTQEFARETAHQLDLAQQRVTSLEAELNEAEANSGRLQSQVAALQGQTDELQRSNGDLAATITDLQQQNNTLQQVNKTLQEEVREQQTQFASLSKIESAIVVPPTDAGPIEASGTLFLNGDQGTFLLAGLEPLPEDQTYQLWVAADDQPIVSAGLVPLNDGPITAFSFTPPLPADEITVVGLSIEPAGGSPEPTGEIVLFTQ